MIEPGLAHRLPPPAHPGHDMIPAQRPDLLGPQARQQRQGDVRFQPGTLSRSHQRDRLLQRERLRRPPSTLSLRRLDQRRDVGLPDRPDQHVVRDLHRPRRHPRRHRRQGDLNIPGGEVGQPDRAQLLVQRLGDRVPVQAHRPRREAIQANSEPVVEGIANRVAPPRPQSALHLLMQIPQLVPDLSLGPPRDLLANTRPSRAEPQAHGSDVPVLGFVPVDRVLAQPATLAQRSVRHGSHNTPSGSLFGSPPRYRGL